MSKTPSVSVCYSPAQYQLFREENNIVVVVDILRATSAMVTAFHHGITQIIPVATIDEAKTYQQKGYLAAAERDGMIVDGFTIGNSPYCYMEEELKGKTIVITTTNGTKAISVAKHDAKEVLIGAFLNLNTIADYLSKQGKNVLVLCAGWKDKFNLEDTLFAGALSKILTQKYNFYTECDSTMAAVHLYNLAEKDLFAFLENSSHRKRLKRLELEKDINYCLSLDLCPVIPVLNGEGLVKL